MRWVAAGRWAECGEPLAFEPRNVCTPDRRRRRRRRIVQDRATSDNRQGRAQHRMPGLPDCQDRRSEDDARDASYASKQCSTWHGGSGAGCIVVGRQDGAPERLGTHDTRTAAGRGRLPFVLVRQCDTWERGRQGTIKESRASNVRRVPTSSTTSSRRGSSRQQGMA